MSLNELSASKSTAMQQLFAAFSTIPFNLTLGLKLIELNEEKVVMSFKMKPELIGNFLQGILHGGVISSVLDMAGGMVVMAKVIDRHQHKSPTELKTLIGTTSTIDLHVNYIQPGKGENFIAESTLLRAGRQIAFTQMKLFNDSQILIATAAGTYLLK